MRKWIPVAVVSMGMLLAGGLWAHAQVEVELPPQIISGADFGFRVDRWDGDTPLGKVVVRHEGKWVEVKIAPSARRLTAN